MAKHKGPSKMDKQADKKGKENREPKAAPKKKMGKSRGK